MTNVEHPVETMAEHSARPAHEFAMGMEAPPVRATAMPQMAAQAAEVRAATIPSPYEGRVPTDEDRLVIVGRPAGQESPADNPILYPTVDGFIDEAVDYIIERIPDDELQTLDANGPLTFAEQVTSYLTTHLQELYTHPRTNMRMETYRCVARAITEAGYPHGIAGLGDWVQDARLPSLTLEPLPSRVAEAIPAPPQEPPLAVDTETAPISPVDTAVPAATLPEVEPESETEPPVPGDFDSSIHPESGYLDRETKTYFSPEVFPGTDFRFRIQFGDPLVQFRKGRDAFVRQGIVPEDVEAGFHRIPDAEWAARPVPEKAEWLANRLAGIAKLLPNVVQAGLLMSWADVLKTKDEGRITKAFQSPTTNNPLFFVGVCANQYPEPSTYPAFPPFSANFLLDTLYGVAEHIDCDVPAIEVDEYFRGAAFYTNNRLGLRPAPRPEATPLHTPAPAQQGTLAGGWVDAGAQQQGDARARRMARARALLGNVVGDASFMVGADYSSQGRAEVTQTGRITTRIDAAAFLHDLLRAVEDGEFDEDEGTPETFFWDRLKDELRESGAEEAEHEEVTNFEGEWGASIDDADIEGEDRHSVISVSQLDENGGRRVLPNLSSSAALQAMLEAFDEYINSRNGPEPTGA